MIIQVLRLNLESVLSVFGFVSISEEQRDTDSYSFVQRRGIHVLMLSDFGEKNGGQSKNSICLFVGSRSKHPRFLPFKLV